MSLRPVKEPAPCAGDHWMLSAKFIAREEWFVAGDIHVLSSAMMDEITQFKAHTGWVESLAIHPSRPLVLSASNDSLIKLWNWETDWSCIQIFEAHSRNVQHFRKCFKRWHNKGTKEQKRLISLSVSMKFSISIFINSAIAPKFTRSGVVLLPFLSLRWTVMVG